jgi:hypothetical protein
LDGDPAKHAVVALLGTVKGEHNEHQHLLPSDNLTKPGIQVGRWLCRTLAANYSNNRVSGPGFCDKKGVMLPTRIMNEMLHEVLNEVRVEHPTYIMSRTNIEEKCSVFRTFCQGSDSRAIAMNVSPVDIDVVNHWTKRRQQARRGLPTR